MKEYLDADRMNFLVWRYLLESNYREAALQLQKEWGIKAPHRQFSFAQHVKSHSLVYAVNKGLSYDSIERESLRQINPDADSLMPEIGIFGPVTSRSIKASLKPTRISRPPLAIALEKQKTSEEDDGEADADGEADEDIVTKQEESEDVSMKEPVNRNVSGDEASGRKRPLSSQPSTTAKKPKLAENGDDSAMAMDIDSTDTTVVNNAYPSPLEGDEAMVARPRTDGPDNGTQEQIRDLKSSATYLDLSLEKNGFVTPPEEGSSPALLLCEWSPSNPNIVMAAGTDSLSRLYTIRSDVSNSEFHTYRQLLEDDLPRSTQVTAIAWSKAEGNPIAIATDQGGQARINIWARDGTRLNTIDVAVGPVYRLTWNEPGTTLLSISPLNDKLQLLTAYKVPEFTPITCHVEIRDQDALDVSWVDHMSFLIAGGSLLQRFTIENSAVVPSDVIPMDEQDGIVHITYDNTEKIAATSSANGNITLIRDNGSRQRISAHTHSISGLKWQPISASAAKASSTNHRLLASASEDGAVLIWEPKADQEESRPKKFLTISGGPVVALAFSPDGMFLAGATEAHVYIWRMNDSTSIPYAKWERPQHPGWSTPPSSDLSTDGTTETFEHCLSWDASSTKVAYGVNSRLALINVQ